MEEDLGDGGAHRADGTEPHIPTPHEVTDEIRERVEAQRPRAADSAQHAADAAREAARNLHGEEAWMAGLVEQGADRLADLAQTLRNNDLRSLLTSAEDLARRQPVLFTGAAMALGFVLTRAVGAAARGGTETSPPHTSAQESRHGH